MSRELPFVEGVAHRYVEANGIRVHVAEAGNPEAEPIVLVHGWPQHWYEWRHLIGPLAETRRVICPDLRGLGWTDAPATGYGKETLVDDLLALLDELSIERTALVGHDWGGWVSFLACLRAPERFEALLALGVVPPMARATPRSVASIWRFWYQAVIASPVGSHTVRALDSRPAGALYDWVGAGVWSPAEREQFLGQFREPERARASVGYYRTFQLRELPALALGRYRSSHLTVPSLLLFGTGETAMSPAMLDGVERRADWLEVELVEGAGHFLADECPELVLQRANELFALQPA